jgi:hypothetical protein
MPQRPTSNEWSAETSWNVCLDTTCRGPVEGPDGSVEFVDGGDAFCIECDAEYVVHVLGDSAWLERHVEGAVRKSETLEERLTRLRGAGWRVAVHNDYMQAGVLHTFWGFSRGNQYVKGEGLTDHAALTEVEAEILALQCVYLGRCPRCERFFRIASLADPRIIEHAATRSGQAAPSIAYLRDWEARWHEASDAARLQLVAERQARQPFCEGSGTAVDRVWLPSRTAPDSGIDLQQVLDLQQTLERATTAMTKAAGLTPRPRAPGKVVEDGSEAVTVET